MQKLKFQTLLKIAMLASASQIAAPAHADKPLKNEHPQQIQLATGQFITPTAARGSVQQMLNPGLAKYPDFIASEAVRSQLSPDGKTLAVLTAGFNSLAGASGQTDVANSTQYIFIYDVSGANKTKPALSQVIKQTNSHVGLVFSPDGKTLYATGGVDDAVYAYTQNGGAWSQSAMISLGHHNLGVGFVPGVGLDVQPNASGLGISKDGKTLAVANNYNDSISVIDTATNTVRFEHDLRPFFAGNEGKDGGVGGTFPIGVAVKGTAGNETAYVTSDRDREVVVIDISSPAAGRLITRIKLDGNGQELTLDASQSKLYVAQDNADQVAVIDTRTNKIIKKIDARAPAGMLDGDGRNGFLQDGLLQAGYGHGSKSDEQPHYTGAATFSVTISPDGETLYAANAGANSIAVIPLTGKDAGTVTGLIPTAYEPHDITFSADGSWMYIINGKGVTGPNPLHLSGGTFALSTITLPGGNAAAQAASNAANQYEFQLEKASLVSAPVPSAKDLPALTAHVAENNFYSLRLSERDEKLMDFLHQHIKHVIYIIKENRTFDQMLGDLKNGANADPSLTMFGAAITPSFHALATNFVTLDNFTDAGDGSMDGWSWALQGRVTNTETITQQINYASVNRGLSYESEGTNRNVPVDWGTVAERNAVGGPPGNLYSLLSAGAPGGTANLLAGTGDHAASDAPFGAQEGYIFNAVLKAGGTVRNYGTLVNNIGSIGTQAAPVSDPFGQGVIQVAPFNPSLANFTDLYFRGFDQNYPDLWRYREWKREFDGFVANHNLPNLSIVRISHDHMGGSASTVLAGLNTPELQQADDDFAAGRLVEAVAHSPYASDTLIFITEDDPQDGPDHVDSHRTTAYVAGPYVKKGAVVSAHYSQVNVLRTIEDMLGTQHINLNTAFQHPMTAVFDARQFPAWTFTATASTLLAPVANLLNLAQNDQPVRYAKGPIVKPRHDAAYWDKAMAGFDFSQADRVPVATFNRVLWKGMMGSKPYPKLAFDRHHKADKDD
jgi:YVTN family beta-propeller protein